MTESCTGGLETGFVTLGYAKVAALGIVQGFTELMPISSTAHMRLVPAVLGWPDPGAAFSAAMQLAALLAIVIYFWQDVRGLLFGTIAALARRDLSDHNLKLATLIILGTVPIVVVGIALAPILNACNSPLRTLVVIGGASLFMALLLAVAELTAHHKRLFHTARLMDALVVGIAQVGALVPGVSRSGSTLTAALFLGFNRKDAARFSFLLGLPAIAAAGAKELWVLYHAPLDAYGWSVLGVGLLTGTLSSFLAVWGLLRILERFSAWPFVIYRALMGVAVLLIAAG